MSERIDSAETVHVLFVDDERHVVETAAMALERVSEGFVVHTETSGDAALSRLDAERVDCVVSDYRMPGMDGLELLEAVRERHPNLPVILSTGKGSEDVASDAISAGVTDYLQKGGGLDQYTVLANRIENAVAKHRAERRLESQRDELATLDRINVVIQDIIRGLVAAATREEIAATVCEHIAAAELYEFAWIAERDASGEFAIRTGAGIDTGAVEVATADGGVAATADELPETGVVEVYESGAGPWQADANDAESMAAVPLSYNEVVYGVLVVAATRPNAFSERERAAFAVLGEVAGFAINAAQNMKLLLSDTAVALELRVTDASAFSTTLTERLDCRYVIDGVVPAADSAVVQYVTIEGADPEGVLDLAAASSVVEDCRLVSTHDEGGVFEVVTRQSPVNTVVNIGGTVGEYDVTDGVGNMLVEVAPETDVRAVVDAFERSHPGSELLSKHTVERSLDDANARRSVEERLTDKQRAALRAAYFAGYYDWPRRSTAEDIAASMGVSSPTLHNHLRKAQQKLLVGFLDES
ncbi:bacterio-opsin activator domain-containing protein [Halococcus sp. AFM35]|uniref:bacterio-opsin activator domain-containing protein n=1 Tax=Halococcus sp. AFM35 TaxID=3421653 RepID=UPI003EBA46BA